ncbi:hypothetical protein C7B76_07105 [filamentous cyanobacterium CCP2]|nr:hypothetical protein C7B76_07105 [filamentous cyanobacterium CCP2]
MTYRIVEIEVTEPLPKLVLKSGETGFAFLLRRKGRAIGFLMRSYSEGTILCPDMLSEWIVQDLKTKLLQENIREELLPSVQGHLSFPSLTVAICTKDRPDNVDRCLKALLKLQQPRGDRPPQFQILVVDNAPSNDRTQNLVASLSQVCYVQEPKPGLDFARNRAIQETKTELLAFLDDDVVVDRHWFDGLVEAWQENPDAAAFTGLVLPYELVTDAQILFERRGGFRRGFEKIRYGKTLPGNPLYPCGAGIFGAGCNMAFRRDVLLHLGGFDEALDTGSPLPGGGDLDIFYRVIRAEYSLVYEPQYLVFHEHRREYDKLRRQYWSWGLGFMAFVVKSYHTDPLQRSRLRWLIKWWFKYQYHNLKQSLRGRNPSPPALVWAEIWGGIVGLFGEYGRSQKRVEQIRKQFS